MNEPTQSPERHGWAFHTKLVGASAALIVPVVALDLACLGARHGGFIALDFRGLLIGAYVVLWVGHSLLATLFVALGRGRTRGVALAAHGGAIASLVAVGAIWVAISDAQSAAALAAAERRHTEAIERAPSELALVEWSLDAHLDPQEVEVIFQASAAGRLELDDVLVRGVSGRFYDYNGHDLVAGERVSFGAAHSDSGDVPTRDLVAVRWVSTESDSIVSIAFSHPDCPDERDLSVNEIYADVCREMPERVERPPASGEPPSASDDEPTGL